MWKLRTMRHDADPALHRAHVERLLAPGTGSESMPAANAAAWSPPARDPRVTRVGARLRATGLDELPQLWNVLRGEMSLVGPRPALPYEVPLWDAWHRARLSVRPGITGAWQARARGRVDFDTMVGMDLEYMRRQSAIADFRLLSRTLGNALRAVFETRGGAEAAETSASRAGGLG